MATATELTPRQQEIAAMLDEDMKAAEIADKLGITRNAVYQQIGIIRKRRGGTTRRRRGPGRPRGSRNRTAPAAASPNGTVTPLQAIRARRHVIETELRETRDAVHAATRALSDAQDRHEKLGGKYDAELTGLNRAEKELVAARPERPKRSTRGKRVAPARRTRRRGPSKSKAKAAQREGANA